MIVQVVIDRTFATRDAEPFDSFRSNVSAGNESNRHRREGYAHQDCKAGRRLGVFLGRHHHENGGNERGEDKEM